MPSKSITPAELARRRAQEYALQSRLTYAPANPDLVNRLVELLAELPKDQAAEILNYAITSAIAIRRK